MKIKQGEYFDNLSKKLLSPSLKLYGSEFVTKISALATVCCGVGHGNIDNENNIYFVFDINGLCKYGRYEDSGNSKLKFFHILSYFRQLPFFVRDYPYDTEKYHCVVFKLPIEKSVFLEGIYTKLYTDDQIETCFNKKTNSYKIVKGDKNYKHEYLISLNKRFGTTLTLSDIDHHDQLEIKPILKDEII